MSASQGHCCAISDLAAKSLNSFHALLHSKRPYIDSVNGKDTIIIVVSVINSGYLICLIECILHSFSLLHLSKFLLKHSSWKIDVWCHKGQLCFADFFLWSPWHQSSLNHVNTLVSVSLHPLCIIAFSPPCNIEFVILPVLQMICRLDVLISLLMVYPFPYSPGNSSSGRHRPSVLSDSWRPVRPLTRTPSPPRH